MPNRFANGVRAIAMCDRCGQQFKLKNLRTEIIKQRKYELLVCPQCWDPDQPQLMLGTFPVEDPQALRNPRKDNTYLTAGTNGLQDNLSGFAGYPTGGSRDIQWGWNPVGGSRLYDAVMTPNYLVATTYVGTATAGLDVAVGPQLGGVSATGSVGNALGPLAVTGVSATGAVGSIQREGAIPTGVSSTAAVGSMGDAITMAVLCPSQSIQFQGSVNGYKMDVYSSTALGNWIATYTGPNFDHSYMFADIGGGPYVGLGYLGQFQLQPGPGSSYYWEAFIGSATPSNFPGLGIYTINNFVVAAQFYISGNTANQYASYSEVGGVATFTWTGDAALQMRDTYGVYPSLPVGTEISSEILYYSGYNWFPSRLYLGTLLSMGYSSGTFTMTYTVANSFVPYPGGTPSAGMMYFQTYGITFLPMVINV